jgi:hypothetical protein
MSREPDEVEAPEELRLWRDELRAQRAPARTEEILRRRFQARQRARRRQRAAYGLLAAAAAVVMALLISRPAPEGGELTAQLKEEVTTDYFPVGFAPPLRPNEFTQIIRVSVPQRELPRFGLPVAVEGGEVLVQADIVLGEDGIARGIRFVRE